MSRASLAFLLALVGCSSDPSSTESASETDETSSSTEATSPTSPTSSDTATPGTSSQGTSSENPDTGADASEDASGDPASSTSASEDSGTTGGDVPIGDPREPGPYGSTTGSASLDLGLGSNVTVTLHLPDDAGPHPVVVLTHGFQLSPSNYTSYGEHLASWGFVVVMPQFPGGLFNAPTHAELRDATVALLDWIESTGDVEAGPLLGRADANAIGLSGHSMGGKISLLTTAGDARPRAVFGIDPVDAAGGPGTSAGPDYPSVTPELMPAITVPVAVVGETTNATGGFGQACAPADQNFQQYFEYAQSPALEIEVLDASHMSFLDDPNCGVACLACPAGSDDPAMTRRLTHGYLVAFFGLTLRDETGWTPWLTGDPMQADVDAGLVSFETANGF